MFYISRNIELSSRRRSRAVYFRPRTTQTPRTRPASRRLGSPGSQPLSSERAGPAVLSCLFVVFVWFVEAFCPHRRIATRRLNGERRHSGWAVCLLSGDRNPGGFAWRASCIAKLQHADQVQQRTQFRDLSGGFRPAARGVAKMLARRKKLAFSGRWLDRSAVVSPVGPQGLERTPQGARQSVAVCSSLATVRPKWGTCAVGQDSTQSSPGCEHRVDSQLRVKTIVRTECRLGASAL